MNQQQLKAEALFKSYTDACGMDADDIRAAKWYAAGMVDYTKFLLEEGGMQGEGERLREELDTELRGATNDIDLIRVRLASGSSKDYLDIKLYELTIRLFKCLDKLSKPQTEQP